MTREGEEREPGSEVGLVSELSCFTGKRNFYLLVCFVFSPYSNF